MSADAPIAWPDHPLAISGGEILATRILPLMGHNARDLALAAAVCRGWRAACRAAAATLSVYREKELPRIGFNVYSWSPLGKYIATVTAPAENRYRMRVINTATGAEHAWDLTMPVPDVDNEDLDDDRARVERVSFAFSRDNTRVLTLWEGTDAFAVWSVPDGGLLVAHPQETNAHKRVDDDDYASVMRFRGRQTIDVGVPGSASEGLVALAAPTLQLWDVSPPPPPCEGGVMRARLRAKLDLRIGVSPAPSSSGHCLGTSFSPNGSKFCAVAFDVENGFRACVYDVASLARLGEYIPGIGINANWTPDGTRVLLSFSNYRTTRTTRARSACLWDFSHPEVPNANASIEVAPDATFNMWSPDGASYFVQRKEAASVEERRTNDGSLIRYIVVPSPPALHSAILSPDAHALVVTLSRVAFAPLLIVFD